VTLPASEPRPGLEATFEPAELAVHIVGAGAESAKRLSRDRRQAAVAAVAAAGSAPPLTELGAGGAAAARSLSYAALADYGRCGYRFLVERVVGIDELADASTPERADGETDDRPDVRRERMGFGRAVHELLEWCARNGWAMPPDDVIEAALQRESAGRDSAPRAREMLAGWLGSGLLAELREYEGALRPEVPFRAALDGGTVLRGTIDLLAPGSGDRPPTVLDYKTDALGGSAPEGLEAAYALQRDLYAAAVAEATGADRVRSAYVFLERPDAPLITELDAAAIDAGRGRIEAMAARVRAGSFEPTPEPHAGLCHDCPARRRLCPHPSELTMRAAA